MGAEEQKKKDEEEAEAAIRQIEDQKIVQEKLDRIRRKRLRLSAAASVGRISSTYKCPDCFISHNSPAELFIHLRLEHTFDAMRYEHVDEEFRESDEESSDEEDSQ